MILRKPYAFLIKHFKMIHIILAITMSYILFTTYRIYKFFRTSAHHNYYATIAYSERNLYVNVFILFVIILIIASLITIYYLLHHKKKPHKFYTYSIIYYIALFIYYVILNKLFKGLVEATIEMQTIRALQDLSLIVMVPQIAVIIYSVLTALGITLKKFNFSEDLKELDITAADSEEVEVNIGFDGYKTKRSVRRNLREFKYYVKENRFVLSCIGIVVGGILFINLISTIINKVGSSGSTTSISNKFSIKVEDSMISNLKSYGEKINNKYYVVVKLHIKNVSNTTVSLDYSNYHLVYKRKNILPNLPASDYFHDFAVPYLGDGIKPNGERTIALAYEVSEKDINSNFVLKVYTGSTITEKKIKSNYTTVRLNPKKQIDIGDAAKVKVNEELSFVNSNVGNTTLKVTNYTINSSYSYTYKDCSTGDCILRNGIITPDYTKSNKSPCLIAIDYEFKLDKDTIYGQYSSDFSDFIDDFLRVKYIVNGQTKYSKAVSMTPDNLEEKEVFQVDKDVMNADQIQLVFTVRNRNHIIVLK